MFTPKSGPILCHPINVSEDIIKELTLLLLGLTSFRIKGLNDKAAYKGFSFRIIDQLRDENLIHGPFSSNVVYLTAEGNQKIAELCEKYGIQFIV